MKFCAAASLLLTFVSTASAHIAITWPLPFRASYNPNSDPSKIDYSITSPLNADGSNFPCKGYQVDMGTPAGASVVTWEAGSQYNFSTGSGALHGGGSCQIALSYDQGKSFTVIHSYIGSCPIEAGQQFNFNVPSDAPTGSAMFAWVWYNMIGNREIYMDCASVTISGGSSKRDTPSTSFKDRPSLFVANLGNGCTTVEGKEVEYPNPGPDVTTKKAAADDSNSFTGTCQPVKGIGAGADTPSSGSGSSGSSGGAASSAASSPAAPATSAAGAAGAASSSATTSMAATTSAAPPVTMSSSTFATVYKTTSSAAVASASPATGAGSTGTSSSSGSSSSGSSSSSGLSTTEDGQCSGAHTCEGSVHGPCCSQWGWCGSTADYCGTGCQAGFGQCGSFLNTTTPAESGSAAGSGSSPAASSMPVAVSSSASVIATPAPDATAALPGGVFVTNLA
ncbi:carbohydrate-binding module family 18 protein [Xylogone sp. PMI_703]|nr:carbohydrate-binding module family 18 protein [Xylogone sp. PMI_703]